MICKPFPQIHKINPYKKIYFILFMMPYLTSTQIAYIVS